MSIIGPLSNLISGYTISNRITAFDSQVDQVYNTSTGTHLNQLDYTIGYNPFLPITTYTDSIPTTEFIGMKYNNLEGNLWFIDNDTKYIRIFSESLVETESFAITGAAMPHRIDISNSEDICFITDKTNNNVQAWQTSTRTYLYSFGGYGTSTGQFDGPTGISVDSVRREVYVIDSGNNRINVFDFDGLFIRSFGNGTETYIGGLTNPDDVIYYNNLLLICSSSTLVVYDRLGAEFTTLFRCSTGTTCGCVSVNDNKIYLATNNGSSLGIITLLAFDGTILFTSSTGSMSYSDIDFGSETSTGIVRLFINNTTKIQHINDYNNLLAYIGYYINGSLYKTILFPNAQINYYLNGYYDQFLIDRTMDGTAINTSVGIYTHFNMLIGLASINNINTYPSIVDMTKLYDTYQQKIAQWQSIATSSGMNVNFDHYRIDVIELTKLPITIDNTDTINNTTLQTTLNYTYITGTSNNHIRVLHKSLNTVWEDVVTSSGILVISDSNKVFGETIVSYNSLIASDLDFMVDTNTTAVFTSTGTSTGMVLNNMIINRQYGVRVYTVTNAPLTSKFYGWKSVGTYNFLNVQPRSRLYTSSRT